jgi:hypothetical protein
MRVESASVRLALWGIPTAYMVPGTGRQANHVKIFFVVVVGTRFVADITLKVPLSTPVTVLPVVTSHLTFVVKTNSHYKYLCVVTTDFRVVVWYTPYTELRKA